MFVQEIKQINKPNDMNTIRIYSNDIHGRINYRANAVNYAKAFCLNPPKEGVYYWSFDHDDKAKTQELKRFERNSHRNNHTGYYN